MRRHLRLYLVQQCLGLFRGDDAAHTDGPAVGHRDLQEQPAHGHFKDIVLLGGTRHPFLNNVVNNAGAVHGMHDKIPDPEHDKPFSFPVRVEPVLRSPQPYRLHHISV